MCYRIKVFDALVHIHNLSVQNGVFPDVLKLAIIKPSFKGGYHQTMSTL